MEIYFLIVLMVTMAVALGSGYPVAFALPGAAIFTVALAAITGYLFTGSTDSFFHSGGPQQWLSAGVTNLRGVYWEVERDTLIAIPLFIFMGITLQRSKIAEDLLVTMAKLFGPVPGGLGISVVFVGALLAATTGIVGATVVAMGLISLPAMLRNNYSKPLATGTIAASGTLGQIIPPSIVLIILADQLASSADQAGTARKALYKEATGEISMPSIFDVGSTSAGEMFLGALVPGLVLVGLYMVYILIFAILKPSVAPAVHHGGQFDRAFWGKVFITLVPPLTLIFLVLGSIIGGIATVNQAGAIGAAGAMVMAGYRLHQDGRMTYVPALVGIAGLVVIAFALANFEMNLKAVDTDSDWIGILLGALGTGLLVASLIWSGIRIRRIDNTLAGIMLETAKTTALVFIILLGAAMLTAAFRAFGGEELVKDFLTGLPGGFWTQFIIVMAVIFVLGFFLDFIEIAVVVVPIVAPILLADPGANITAVWLGVMIGLNIQTSFLTPPFGFALFYLRGVADATVKTLEIYKGVIPFILLQLAALAIVGYFPSLANYLPARVSFLSETAPPPRNPQLQYCIEREVFTVLDQQGTAIRDRIAAARTVDLSYMPDDVAQPLTESLENAEQVFTRADELRAAEAAVLAASPQYSVVHHRVREIERDARKIAGEIEENETALRRSTGDDQADRRRQLEGEIAELKAEREALLAQIPADWQDRYKAFAELNKAETDARRNYQRAADDAYSGLAEAVAVMQSADLLESIQPDIEALRGISQSTDKEEIEMRINAISDRLSNVDGGSDISSLLSGARRDLTGNRLRQERAQERIAEAIGLVASEVEWRKQAAQNALPALSQLESLIRDNIGLRQQERLPREMALRVAACRSHHRDVSLNF